MVGYACVAKITIRGLLIWYVYVLCGQMAGNRLTVSFWRPGWLGHPSRRAFPVVEVKTNSESKKGKSDEDYVWA